MLWITGGVILGGRIGSLLFYGTGEGDRWEWLKIWHGGMSFHGGLLGVAIVSAIAYRLARPVPGVGIAIPLFVPPLVAAATGLLLAPDHAPALAYIAGTMGCLIGADLLNLHRLPGLGAPVASIGGAGTFDGIFFTGIIAVLLT